MTPTDEEIMRREAKWLDNPPARRLAALLVEFDQLREKAMQFQEAFDRLSTSLFDAFGKPGDQQACEIVERLKKEATDATTDQRLRDMVTDNQRFLHPMITDDVRDLLARHDRYEAALREIAAVTRQEGPDCPSSQHMADTAHKIAKEALAFGGVVAARKCEAIEKARKG